MEGLQPDEDEPAIDPAALEERFPHLGPAMEDKKTSKKAYTDHARVLRGRVDERQAWNWLAAGLSKLPPVDRTSKYSEETIMSILAPYKERDPAKRPKFSDRIKRNYNYGMQKAQNLENRVRRMLSSRIERQSVEALPDFDWENDPTKANRRKFQQDESGIGRAYRMHGSGEKGEDDFRVYVNTQRPAIGVERLALTQEKAALALADPHAQRALPASPKALPAPPKALPAPPRRLPPPRGDER